MGWFRQANGFKPPNPIYYSVERIQAEWRRRRREVYWWPVAGAEEAPELQVVSRHGHWLLIATAHSHRLDPSRTDP